jgi:hypothetical protein
MPKITRADIENWFTYHPPGGGDTLARYTLIRQGAKDLALTIVNECPPCADTTAAIRKLREAVMTANAAIACYREGS